MKKYTLPKSLTGSAMVLAVTASVFAQEKPFTQAGTGQPAAPPAPAKAPPSATSPPAPAPTPAEPNLVDKLFNQQIPDVLAKGKFNLNARLRFEYADQNGGANGATPITDSSYAPTLRTRFGYTSGSLYGLQGMLEGENVTALGPDGNYNAAGSNGKNYKAIVADPETTELNQAWLGYTYTNWISLKAGRQRIALDNHRFVGDVGWRQNMQTFDAITAESRPLKDLSLYYGYLWEVNRVFGDVEDLPAANRDFESQSHLINISYSPFTFGRFVGYSYLLDLENPGGFAQSCATYGGYFAGNAPLADGFSLGYRAELAWQTDYGDSPQDYEAEYYNLELSGTFKRFSVGAGYEVLGTDSNDNGAGGVGFRTPLATLHAFNGWADVFLNTPGRGLQDLYAFAQVVLPWQVPVRAVFHKYDADSGGADFGHEVNLQASKKFGKNWTALVKYAYYAGDETVVFTPTASLASDVEVQKFWAQIEFNF